MLHSQSPNSRRKRTRGGAVLEMALLSPWVFFLSVGALDWGFYGSALISLQSATRSAVLYTSTSATTATDTATACTIILGELRKLPNIGSSTTSCTSNPLVTATAVTGPDGGNAAQVSIRYQSVSLIPIPGVLAKQFVITRVATMRLRG